MIMEHKVKRGNSMIWGEKGRALDKRRNSTKQNGNKNTKDNLEEGSVIY